MNESGELKAPSELRKLNIDEPVTSNIVAGLKEAFIHWKKFPNIFSPSKWFSKAASDTVRKTATRGQWFLRGSRRGNPWMKWNRKNWDEVIDVAGIGAAKKQYIYELLFRYFQFQIAWGLGETILQSLNATRSNKETRDKVMGCVNARALPDSDSSKASQLKASCESIKTMSEISLLHYWEDPMVVVLLKNMIYDWGDKDAGIMDMATDLFPGKLDDTIIDWVIPYFSGTRDVKTLEEWAENMAELTDEAQQEVIDIEEQIEEVIEDEDINSTPDESTTSGEPGSLEHINDVFGGGVTQEGEFFIWENNKYKWNGTDYEWVQ
jgi:hypothetical protein